MNGIIFRLGFGLRFFVSFLVILFSFTIVLKFLGSQDGIWGIHPAGIVICSGIFGLLISFFIIRSIKCPKCNYQILWNYINNPKKMPKGYSPFYSCKCVNCGYEPETK